MFAESDHWLDGGSGTRLAVIVAPAWRPMPRWLWLRVACTGVWRWAQSAPPPGEAGQAAGGTRRQLRWVVGGTLLAAADRLPWVRREPAFTRFSPFSATKMAVFVANPGFQTGVSYVLGPKRSRPGADGLRSDRQKVGQSQRSASRGGYPVKNGRKCWHPPAWNQGVPAKKPENAGMHDRNARTEPEKAGTYARKCRDACQKKPGGTTEKPEPSRKTPGCTTETPEPSRKMPGRMPEKAGTYAGKDTGR